MPADQLDLVARLSAYELGRAVPMATQLQVAIRVDALVLCPLMMAGEETTIYIVAIGRIGASPEIYAVGDPRVRDQQYALYEWLGQRIEQYWTACREAGTYPQIWVSSSPVQAHLDRMAERLRYNRENANVRRFGELLSYSTDRYPIAGQQALHTATGALRRHWATGQMEGEDEHLLAVRTWHEPPRGQNLLAAVAVAEQTPMGIRTDPSFDRDVLEPLVASYNAARRDGARQRELVRRTQAIRAALEPLVAKIYENTQWAITRLRRSGLPPLPALADIEQRETDAFLSFMASRDAGHPIALRDSAKAAVFKLTEREDAIQQFEAAVLLGDRVARSRARLAGRVLTGTATKPARTWIAPYRFKYTFELVTTQPRLRVRRGDEFCWLENPRLRVSVTDIRRSGTTVRIFLRITAGQRSVGLPSPGAVLELGPAPPDWYWIWLQRKQLRSRLDTTPWTHDETGLPRAIPRPDAPTDPLAAVEQLR